MNHNAYFITRSGRTIAYRDDYHDPAQFDINDIATSLAGQPRFLGHTCKPYSVAEHCMRVAAIGPDSQRLQALMHDAAEAYTGDIPTPLKAAVPELREIGRRIDAAIAERFSIAPTRATVDRADLTMLLTEARDLCDPRMAAALAESYPDVRPMPAKIEPLPNEPRLIAHLFLQFFEGAKLYPEGKQRRIWNDLTTALRWDWSRLDDEDDIREAAG